ncbi:hypothetical protein BD410DRAFT_761749 [Rickenella mellea]|uniref:Putative gamma-glutamylcyclotransferase n=1 Tax=Rickenella mellea TaxID=50990 RepID=A0A4Y7QLX5_9AGAM|nr:hypothetical protein BD410DRAFT_761749 [Rickenella mellea]
MQHAFREHQERTEVRPRRSARLNPSPSSSLAFFYGTLMYPSVLRRVIRHDGSHLNACPAVLPAYIRHKVAHATFPAVIPFEQSRLLIPEEIPMTEQCVRGVLVRGLTEKDMKFIKSFEGNLYEYVVADVQPLKQFASLDSNNAVQMDVLASDTENNLQSHSPEYLRANVYVWRLPLSDLLPEIWTFEEFERDALADWM